MKILMIQPYGSSQPPLGLCQVSAELKEAGYTDIVLVDLLRGDIDLYSPVRTKEYLMEQLKKKPDAVLITASTATFREAREIAQLARPYGRVLLLGGPHATTFQEKVLEKTPEFDMVVYGEADETIALLMNRIETNSDFAGIRGVIYRKDGKIVKNPPVPPIMDLDKLPFPDRDILDIDSYAGPLTILTSRGCPHACTFCSRPVTGATFRGRSAKNVVDEIEFLLKKYPKTAKKLNNLITLIDENAGVNKARLISICDEMLARHVKVTIPFTNGLHVSSADPVLYSKLKQIGCTALWFGVESGSDKILTRIKKGATKETIKKAVRIAHEAGIKNVAGHFIIGMEDETIETARETIRFVKEAGFDSAAFNHAAPQPGTPLWDYARSYGKLLFEYDETIDYSNFKHDHTAPQFETPEFTKEERMQAYQEAVQMMDGMTRRKMLSVPNILKFLLNLKSPLDLFWAVRRIYTIHAKQDLRRIIDLRPSLKHRQTKEATNT
ncbi:MAG TPA: radical SAM protein [Nanoarchaeota archaeon]|nr:radical SAM protein [Nanoarchaeota archaeon]